MSEYGHSHEHSHEHTASSPEEVLALLKYMLEHNRHHAEELHDLAHQVPEDVDKDQLIPFHTHACYVSTDKFLPVWLFFVYT